MNPLKNEPVVAGVSLVGVALWLMTFVEWTDAQEAGFVSVFVALAGYVIRRYVTPTELAEARVQDAIDSGMAVTATTATTPRGPRPVSCSACHGAGRVPGVRPDQIVLCSACGGTGTVLE